MNTNQKKSKPSSRFPQLPLGAAVLPECSELHRRLHDLHLHQPAADPQATPMRIGIEDAHGELAFVVETTRLTEAVKVFETLSEFGLVPGHGRCTASDGRMLVRTYRRLKDGCVQA
jgi:hypothetical protein